MIVALWHHSTPAPFQQETLGRCLHATTSGKRIDLNLKECGKHRMRQISISPLLWVRHDSSKSSKIVTFLFDLCILC